MSGDALDRADWLSIMSAVIGPEVTAATVGVRAIAHFDISEAKAKPFLRFHGFITDPQPLFISHWRADPNREHRYHTLCAGILTHVRGALSAVEYHRQNLLSLESEVNALLDSIDFKTVLGNSTVGLGGTAKLDFEYQAYVFAYRRCLDYLTRSLAAYFGRSNHSFREMRTRCLHGAKPAPVADALSAVHEKYEPLFAFVMSNDGNTSVRDRIAHHEGIGAGCVNISRLGVCLAGGGENLNGWKGGKLADALAERTEALHDCIEAMLNAFIHAAGEFERSRPS